jgi:hypothetical protein
MTTTIPLKLFHLSTLNLTPAQAVIEGWIRDQTVTAYEQQLRFDIEYPREPEDQRELSEIPEVRLWFIRLDTVYPWLPFLLNWREGELARYAAMLVPHQFSRQEGIQYNPEALDIFVMQKVFTLAAWMQRQGIESESKLKSMVQTFGYELDAGLFDLIRSSQL